MNRGKDDEMSEGIGNEMKILMWGRFDLFDIGGGDKIQIENTALELRKLGVDVDISTSLDTELEDYDLVHIFQLDWIPETFLYAKKAKNYGKPVVLSPIHHSVEEVKRFDNEYAFGFRKVSKLLCNKQHTRDTIKNIYRAIFDKRKRQATALSIHMGLKNQHIQTLKMADEVLVQTELEAQDLIATYGVGIDWIKVQNGVGEQFIKKENHDNPLDIEDYVLCVGRIEARKNQLSIIEAVKQMKLEEEVDTTLVFVGKKSNHHGAYIDMFNKEVSKHSWIEYVPFTPYEEMPGLYQHAKVSVSASWFETTGLTSLESLFMGTNVVASGNRAKEFLGDYASYCDPGDVNSIKNAIRAELSKDPPEFPDEARKEFTWKNAAKKTLMVYRRLLE